MELEAEGPSCNRIFSPPKSTLMRWLAATALTSIVRRTQHRGRQRTLEAVTA
jgi:hypothetical protein